jgi:Signal transduction histidine kinase
MKPTIWNRSLVILFLLSFVTCVVYLTVTIVRVPAIGAVLTLDRDGHYYVHSFEPAGQAQIRGIQIGDRILEVNGNPVHEFDNVIKYHALESADSVLVLHRNQSTELIEFSQAWSSDRSLPELMIQLYIPGISLIVFCAFSGFLFHKKKSDPAAMMLILFFISIGLSYYSSSASLLRDRVAISLIYVVLPAIPLWFMGFMNYYLKRYSLTLIRPRTLYALFATTAVISLFSLIYIWTDVFSFDTFTYIKGAYSAFVLAGNVLCAYKLVAKFMKYRNTKMRSLFKITLISHLVAFTPFAVFNLLPQLFGAKQLLPPSFTALFLFVLPVVYFYLSTSNQLFDIDFILTRFKYYTALSLIPSILVAAAVAIVMSSEPDSFWSGLFATFVVVYVGITLFLYVKEQIDHRFRPKLFKAMYSYQDSLDRFSRNIAKVMKQSDLEDVIRQEISDLLPVGRITFMVVDQAKGTATPAGDSQEEKITADFLLCTSDSLKLGELIDLPFGLGLIIGRQRTRYHILWIGSKTNHTRFNSDEIRWLKTMANYSSIVFENLYLIEGLIEDLESEVRKEQSTPPWVLRLLFLLSENERRKLAADLHDSALQDQLIWYRRLESVMTDHPMTDRLGSELEAIKEGLLDVIHQIRETCNELRPPLLKEMGLVEALESIIEHTQMRVNFEVLFRPKAIKEQLEEEQITAVYRIVQELLRNADKHAAAKTVTLELEVRGGTLYFRYADDGVGMDLTSMEETFEHMGLSGIKERVASLEGDISFVSEPGKGLEVVILMPVMPAGGRSERGITGDTYLIG